MCAALQLFALLFVATLARFADINSLFVVQLLAQEAPLLLCTPPPPLPPRTGTDLLHLVKPNLYLSCLQGTVLAQRVCTAELFLGRRCKSADLMVRLGANLLVLFVQWLLIGVSKLFLTTLATFTCFLHVL